MVNTYVLHKYKICKVTQMPSHHQLTCICMDMNGLRFWIIEEIYNICSSNSGSFQDEMELDSLEMNLEWKFRERQKTWQYFYLFTELNYGKFFKKLFHTHFQLHLKWKILYKINIYIYVVQWVSFGFGFRFGPKQWEDPGDQRKRDECNPDRDCLHPQICIEITS